METEVFQEYKNLFAPNYHKPYIVRSIHGGTWKTRHRKLNDIQTELHLNQEQWIGVPRSWYTNWALFDLDSPTPDALENILHKSGLQKNQYLIATSPSWQQDGSMHIFFKPILNGKPVTDYQFQRRIDFIRSLQIEIYPCGNRCVRLPAGKDQFILKDDIIPLKYLTWQDFTHWFNKLEEYDLNVLDKYLKKREKEYSNESVPELQNLFYNNSKSKGALWFKEGLTVFRTRNEAIGAVVMWLFSQNYPPEITIDLTRKWLIEKHNGLSRTINAGKFDEAYKDIINWTDWTYKTLKHREVYPDSVENKRFGVYHSDMEFIAKHFKKDTKMQKKMFKLIGYFRPRMKHHEWVYCARGKWAEINGEQKRHYKQFQNKLHQMGLLEKNDSYSTGRYTKRFKLHLPKNSDSKFMQQDDRNISSFNDAVKTICEDAKEAMDMFGLPYGTAYDWFRNL